MLRGYVDSKPPPPQGVRKARARQSTLSRTDLEELAKACQTADRAVREEELDIKEALAMLSRNDIIILVDIFNRFSLGTGGVLTRKNIHNALWAAGVCNVSTVDDQWKLKFVQEEVLNHTRGSVEGGDTSEAYVSQPLRPCMPFPLRIPVVCRLCTQRFLDFSSAVMFVSFLALFDSLPSEHPLD